MGVEGIVPILALKKRWENLKQKYKELKTPKTEGGEMTAASCFMDEVLGASHIITPLALASSSSQGAAVMSFPSQEQVAASVSTSSSTTSSDSASTTSSTSSPATGSAPRPSTSSLSSFSHSSTSTPLHLPKDGEGHHRG
nr:putative protein TPRXL [Labrus bergylta]